MMSNMHRATYNGATARHARHAPFSAPHSARLSAGPRTAARASPAGAAAAAAAPTTTAGMRQLLDDLTAGGLSPCRFVVVGSGAILESVGSWSPVRYAERPTGAIATISNADKSFEAHFVLSKIKEARFALVDKPGLASPLRVVRLVNADGAVAMSVMLHKPGDEQAAAWDALRAKYGDAVALEEPAGGAASPAAH